MTLHESIAIHQRLRALLPTIREQRVFLRAHSRVDPKLRIAGAPSIHVDRDRIFCALISKAAESHNAILLLVDRGFTNDANALLRVLIENYVVAAWIMQDAGLRLDCYTTALQFVNNRYAEVLEEHYPNADASMLAVAQEVQQNTERFRELMGGTHTSWARRFDDAKGKLVPLKIFQMFADVAAGPATPAAQAAPAVQTPASPVPAPVAPAAAAAPANPAHSFLYDVPYFEGSAAVHSTVSSLKYLLDSKSTLFSITESRDDDALATVLIVANLTFLLILGEFGSYAGLDLNPELDAIGDELKASME